VFKSAGQTLTIDLPADTVKVRRQCPPWNSHRNRPLASVSLEHVDRVFRDRKREIHAIRDLSLHVRDGELLTLVGPSGCGKTTTLRVIAGLDEPSAGVIRIADREVNRIPAKDRDVAMVFQNYALYPHMTVYQNIAFPLKMRKFPKPEIQQKVGATAERMGLSALLDRKPAALSGGEKQRTAVARAIVRNPKAFLLDEPLSNLDAPLRVELRGEIKRLQRTLGTTTIYVTHDQEEAMTLADRIAVMRNGILQQCGTPLEVYNKPANRFVAGFVGSPAMNLIAGTIVENGGTRKFCFANREIEITRLPSISPPSVGPIILGIRPQDVQLRTNPDSDQRSDDRVVMGEGTIRLIETTGDALNLRVGFDDREIVVRSLPQTSIAEGDRVRVELQASRIHFFQSDGSGERID